MIGAEGLSVRLMPSFDFLSGEYEALYARCDATPFQGPRWLDLFYRDLVPASDGEPVIVTLRDGERLVGVVPLVRRRKGPLRFLDFADLGVTDYAAPVLDPGTDPARFAKLVASSLPSHDALRVQPVRAEHVAAVEALFGAPCVPMGVAAHATDFPDGYDAWRTHRMDRSLGKQVARKARKAARDHGAALRVLPKDQIAAAVQRIAAQRAGRFEGDPIQRDAVAAFYASAAEACAARGEADVFALVTADGEEMGLVFGLRDPREGRGGAFLYLLIGCDYERWGTLSPGYVMYDAIIRDQATRGATRFDFTIGDEPFKAKFGTEATPMHALFKARTLAGRGMVALWKRRLAQGADGG